MLSNTCKLCDKHFPSFSTRCVHVREKHSHYNTILVKCSCCLQMFHSVIFNNKKKQYYNKCENCRELQIKLKTNNLIHDTYVYDDTRRYLIQFGEAVQVCGVYDCNNKLPCKLHVQSDLQQCYSTKCNKCYIKNGLNQCNECIKRGHMSKNNTRNKIKAFKEQLGGKCVDCGFNELFYLEFDHIDPLKKQVQITRSAPSAWEGEKDNLELRCGRCHRIKTAKIRKSWSTFDYQTKNKETICRIDKRKFVNMIKQTVGCCQLCKWTFHDKHLMCSALDFDHIFNDKFKQVSNLYTSKKETIAKEILKTRLICRHCHELHTCLQRGGKALQIYYSEGEIQTFKERLEDRQFQETCQEQLKSILNSMGYI
jgi:hypothetical protein